MKTAAFSQILVMYMVHVYFMQSLNLYRVHSNCYTYVICAVSILYYCNQDRCVDWNSSGLKNRLCCVCLCPCDNSLGGIMYYTCLSVRLSVHLSVRHTFRYEVCIISSSHSLWWINLKLHTDVTDILKMCMKNFEGHELILDNFTGVGTLKFFWLFTSKGSKLV